MLPPPWFWLIALITGAILASPYTNIICSSRVWTVILSAAILYVKAKWENHVMPVGEEPQGADNDDGEDDVILDDKDAPVLEYLE